jgi:hypothetical protein
MFVGRVRRRLLWWLLLLGLLLSVVVFWVSDGLSLLSLRRIRR